MVRADSWRQAENFMTVLAGQRTWAGGRMLGWLLAGVLCAGGVAAGQESAAGARGVEVAPAMSAAGQTTPAVTSTSSPEKAGAVVPLPELQKRPDAASVFSDGGPLMWVILLASVVGLTFSLERFFALRGRLHLQKDLEERVDWLLEHESLDAALEYLDGQECTQSRALAAVLRHCGEGRKEMEQALEDELARALWDERRNIKPVGMVATVAPLLGLLGTVMGMIDAFRNASESGMDNPALFAGGIYMALYTTAFGLIVAIPFLLIHHYLRGRAELILRRVEDRVLRYIARREFDTVEVEAA